jgi:cobalt/nickel transport system permease protein
LDGRVKLLLLLGFLISLALLKNASALQLSVCFLYLLLVLIAAKLPLLAVLRISFLVLPFVGLFALLIYLSGDVQRALSIVLKSYLSALAALACIASTPLPQLVAAARSLHVPAFLVEVTQLVYRYLFVLSGEIHTMRIAFTARGGHTRLRTFQPASGMVAVLFARAFEKAAAVHNAMLSRGYSGTLTGHAHNAFKPSDFVALSGGLVAIVVVHFL